MLKEYQNTNTIITDASCFILFDKIGCINIPSPQGLSTHPCARQTPLLFLNIHYIWSHPCNFVPLKATADYPKLYLYRRIVEAKLFIDRNYLDSIDINTIAGEACFSKYHFLRLFKQIYGVSPHQYLNGLRIRRAKQLLQDGATISHTCYALGFTSLSSFNKLFKGHLNISPSAYSKKAKHFNRQVASAPLTQIPQCFVLYMGWDK